MRERGQTSGRSQKAESCSSYIQYTERLKGVVEQAVEDFTYSKTSHFGYVRDHMSRAGLSALTTPSPEILSIHSSITASRQQHKVFHAFTQNLCSFPTKPKGFRSEVKRSLEDLKLLSHQHVRQLTHSLVMQLSHLI